MEQNEIERIKAHISRIKIELKDLEERLDKILYLINQEEKRK